MKVAPAKSHGMSASNPAQRQPRASLNEADTCRLLITPKLQAAGWEQEPHSIAEQRYYTDGRIVVRGSRAERKKGKRTDYLLRYTRDFPMAVVEAKAEDEPAAAGLQQAKEYTEILKLKFAYATNGIEIIEFDYLNGTLFGDGVCARIKEELLKEFNLHTIVRLPNGVFAPYTSIPTNLLFFDRSGPTREVWYYEQPLPEGRKNYTKTAPIQFEEFAPLVAWWNQREEDERAWKVSAAELLANGCNLDRKNPRAKEDITHLPPEQLAADILKKEQRIAEIMGNIQKLLGKHGS